MNFDWDCFFQAITKLFISLGLAAIAIVLLLWIGGKLVLIIVGVGCIAGIVWIFYLNNIDEKKGEQDGNSTR